ncbi:MAG: hypothetical protein J6A43_00585, partial [Clostridia bacterium]|nr:hypothetical protein [Clostridia bacterium]
EIRLKNYDYSRNGLYFITICTKDKIPYLSEINGVGDGVLDVPQHKLTEYGTFVNDQIKEINSIYEKIKIIKYVIMPDHVHMIIYIFDEYKIINGTSGDSLQCREMSEGQRVWALVRCAVPYK